MVAAPTERLSHSQDAGKTTTAVRVITDTAWWVGLVELGVVAAPTERLSHNQDAGKTTTAVRVTQVII